MTDDTKDKKDKAKKSDFEKHIEVLDAGKAKADDRHRAASEAARIYQQLQIAHNHALADIKRLRAEANQLAADKITAERLQPHALSELAKAQTRIEELIGQPAKLQGKLDRASQLVGDLLKKVERLEGQKAISPPITRTIIAKPAYEIWRTNLKADTIVLAKVDAFWFTFNGDADRLHEIEPGLDVVVAVVGEDQRTNCIRFPLAERGRVTNKMIETRTSNAWVEKIGEEPVKPKEESETEEPTIDLKVKDFWDRADDLDVVKKVGIAILNTIEATIPKDKENGKFKFGTQHIQQAIDELEALVNARIMFRKEFDKRGVDIVWANEAATELREKIDPKFGKVLRAEHWTQLKDDVPEILKKQNAIRAAGPVKPDGSTNTNGPTVADPKLLAPTLDANAKSSPSTNSPPSGATTSVETAPQDGSGKSTHKGEINRVGPK